MAQTPEATAGEPTRRVRRRASRAAGPTSDVAVATVTTKADNPTTVTPTPPRPISAPPRRRPNGFRVAVLATVAAVLLLAGLGTGVWVLNEQHQDAQNLAARDQQYVDTASQTVVNMFTYTQQNIDQSVNTFVDGTSGPLRDMLSQNNNVENLTSMFRDTNASSEAVVNAAALEKVDETSQNGSVLVAVRVTVTDIDGVNKPSQAYRLRVIVHKDDNGRMTGYDLKYPDGGN